MCEEIMRDDTREWLKGQYRLEYKWLSEQGVAKFDSTGRQQILPMIVLDADEMRWFYGIECGPKEAMPLWEGVDTIESRESYDEWVSSVQEGFFLPMFDESNIESRSEGEVCNWACIMRGFDRLRIKVLATMIQAGQADDLEVNYRGDVCGRYWYEKSDWSLMSTYLTSNALTKDLSAQENLQKFVTNWPLIRYGRRTPNYSGMIMKFGTWQRWKWAERQKQDQVGEL